MEPVSKIVITLFVVLAGAKVLYWTWTSHIDPIATIYKFFKQEPKIADVLVTRDPNKPYQGEGIVADVTGDVEFSNGEVLFKQISNISGLNQSQPIEYRRYNLKILSVGRIIGMKSVVSNKGSSVLKNVMEDVLCVKID